MPTANSVQELIDLLHIDVIGVIETTHDEIRESYEVPAVAQDFEDFKRILIDYINHHNSIWYGSAMNPNMTWGRVRAMLQDLPEPQPPLSRVRGFIEAQGSYIQAVKNSLTGRHGGLIAVVDQIADALKQEAVRQWIQGVFLTSIDPNNYDRKVELAREYLAQYGHLLMQGEDMVSPYELATQLETLIETHVQVINQLRSRLQ